MANMQEMEKTDQEKFIDLIEDLVVAINDKEWQQVPRIKREMKEMLG